jgi:hypothetical protein
MLHTKHLSSSLYCFKKEKFSLYTFRFREKQDLLGRVCNLTSGFNFNKKTFEETKYKILVAGIALL